MSETSNMQNSLFETMKLFSESATANSKATITVGALVTEVQDEAAGVYSVEYLGSTLTAHATSDVTYSVGDNVYILVPEGDFTKEKLIIGLISANASIYTNSADGDKNYYEVSDNLIDNTSGIIKLTSSEVIKPEDKKIDIIDEEKKKTFGVLINEYLNDYRTFKFSFSVKTSLSKEKQGRGNYGICLNIPLLKDAAAGQGEKDTTWEKVYLDVENFVRTPYRYLAWSPQQIYFTIDKQSKYDDSRLPYYSYYCYDFPSSSNKNLENDIQLKDISLCVVNEMTQKEMEGCTLTLKASEGEYYLKEGTKDTKTIVPTLRVNGKVASLNKVPIYWFIEDTGIDIDNEYYISYGGRGWRCLNPRENICYNDDGSQTFNYRTSIKELEVSSEEVRSKTRFKCVTVYNENTISSVISLKNQAVNENIILTSSKNLLKRNGVFTFSPNINNTYTENVGQVNLSVLVYSEGITDVEDAERNRIKVFYNWSRYDKDNNYIRDTSDFFTLVSDNNNKIIKIGEKQYFLTQVSFPVREIDKVNTIYCTPKYIYLNDESKISEKQLGTTSVKIITKDDNLNLNIVNEDIIYKYDINGNSPTSNSYGGLSASKIAGITPLAYTLYHSNGDEFTEEEYFSTEYCWRLPKPLISLFDLEAGAAALKEKDDNYYFEDDNYYYFKGYGRDFNLGYRIADRFDSNLAEEKIKLTITFKEKTLEKNVNISFIKDGSKKNNGTSYSAQLICGGSDANSIKSVPYGILNANGITQKLKFVYDIDNGNLYKYNYEEDILEAWSPEEKEKVFVQVYQDEERLDPLEYKVSFSMFDEKITNPCFSIASEENTSVGILTFEEENIKTETSYNCNIIQAKIIVNEDKGNASCIGASQVIYAYYPLEFTIIKDFNGDLDELVVPSLDGGFSEVMYALDGTNPSYNGTNNFVLKANTNFLSEYFKPTWEAYNHLSLENEDKTFSKKIKPNNKYDDGASKNYICTTLNFEDKNDDNSLERKREKIKAEIENREQFLEEEKNSIKCLEAFAEAYNNKISGWHDFLDEIKDLLVSEVRAKKALQKIQKNAAAALSASSSEELKTILTSISENAIDADNRFLNLGLSNDSEDAILEALSSFEENKIIYTDLVSNLKNQELSYIRLINEQIDNYQKERTNLEEKKYINQFSEYSNFRNSLNFIITTLDNSLVPAYKDLRVLLNAAYNEFSDDISYTSLIKKFQYFEEILSSVFIIKDNHTIKLKEYLQEKIDEENSSENEEITLLRREEEQLWKIVESQSATIIHIRPIVLYFNRYEMSNINAWDGNKIETGEDNTYLLAPQVGVGKKEDDKFTGLVMGIKNITDENDDNKVEEQQAGLFGYYEGTQSLKVDAQTGAAVFGSSETGQIVTDPSSNKGQIYSKNYWPEYDSKTGLPSVTAIGGDNGFLIDLSDDEKIHLGVSSGKIYSGAHTTFDSKEKGFYLSNEGLSIGEYTKIDLNGVATFDKTNISGGLTENEVSKLIEDKGYITSSALSDYAKTSAIPTTVAELSDSANYAKTSAIPTTVAELSDSANYAKTSEAVAIFIINATYDFETGITTIDKTYTEILAAYNAGKVLKLILTSNTYKYELSLQESNIAQTYFIFNYTRCTSAHIDAYYLMISKDNTVSYGGARLSKEDDIKKGETITYDGPYNSLDALKAAVQSGTVGTIYLVKSSGTSGNAYQEYIWVTPTNEEASFELIGTTLPDLSGYLEVATAEETYAKLSETYTKKETNKAIEDSVLITSIVTADNQTLSPSSKVVTLPLATRDKAGLMSKDDKINLSNLVSSGAEANEINSIKINDTELSPTNKVVTIPQAAINTYGCVKTTSTIKDVTGYTPVPIKDGIPYYKDTNTTYSVANPDANGLMSKEDKAKLNDIEPNAEVNTITSVNGMKGDINTEYIVNLSTTSESALSGKCETEYQNIGEALAAGKRVWLKLTFTSDQIPYVILPLVTNDTGNAAYAFCGTWGDTIYLIRIDDGGYWRGTTVTCATLEDVETILKDYATIDKINNSGFITSSALDGYDYATKKYVNDAVAGVSGGGDVDLTKYLTKTEAEGIYATISTVNGKVSAVSGKDLSTNDYTTDEKNKLADIETGANKYTLPTAEKGTLGGVTTTSTVTSATGYTAVPIISGVPYYKDTNTTYSVASDSKDGLMSSTNFTKLTNISRGAQVNVIETVQTNGTALGITDKMVDIPTEFTLNWATKALTQGSMSKTIDDLKAAIIINPGLNLKVTSYTEDETYSLSYRGCGRNAGSLKFEGIVYEESYVAIPHALCIEYYDGWSSSLIALEENVITTIKVNNTEQDVKNKTVNITVPTYSTATQDTNGLLSSDDKKIIDNLSTTYATKAYVDESISGVTGGTFNLTEFNDEEIQTIWDNL